MSNKDFERRSINTEFRVAQKGKVTVIEGYAARFNSYSEDLGGFVEQITPGAFTKTLQEADVRALLNHDPNIVLGRNTAGTLRMAQDDSGLYYEVDLPDTTAGRDLAVSMERGDITQSSFGFMAIKDNWGLSEEKYPVRSLNEVALFDVSPVTYPAYLGTSSGIGKRALEQFAEQRGIDPSKVQEFLTNLVNNTDIEAVEEIPASVIGRYHVPTDVVSIRRDVRKF